MQTYFLSDRRIQQHSCISVLLFHTDKQDLLSTHHLSYYEDLVSKIMKAFCTAPYPSFPLHVFHFGLLQVSPQLFFLSLDTFQLLLSLYTNGS